MISVFEAIKKDEIYHQIRGSFELNEKIVGNKKNKNDNNYKMIIYENKRLFLATDMFFKNAWNCEVIEILRRKNTFFAFAIANNSNVDFYSSIPWIDGVIYLKDDKEMLERKLHFGISGYRVFEKLLAADIRIGQS